MRAQPGLVSSSWVFNQMSSGRGGNTSQEGWGHGRHLPLALGQLLSVPCRGGRAWTPGLLDPRTPGCCSLCSQGEDALLPQAQGAFHKQELAREHLQAQAAGGGKCLAEAPPHGGPG